MADSLFTWRNLQAEKLNASLARKQIWSCMRLKQTIYGTSRIPPKHFYLYAHNNNLLHCNPFIFNIWHVCVTSRVYVRCAPAYRRILTRSLNNKTNIAPLTLDQVSVGQWRSLFQLPQNSNTPTMRLNTPRFQTSTPMGAQMGANAFAI